MQETEVARSIGSSHDAIGARAARHPELAFRGFTVGHGAEEGTRFLRWASGDAHPLGNVAIVSDPSDADAARCRRAARGPQPAVGGAVSPGRFRRGGEKEAHGERVVGRPKHVDPGLARVRRDVARHRASKPRPRGVGERGGRDPAFQ
jgi:hypothetical protein